MRFFQIGDPKAHVGGYAITRALAAEAFKKVPGTEALFYPSVQDYVGMNVAIEPSVFDAKMNIVTSRVMQVQKARPFGFFDTEVCLEASGIGDAGDFLWRKPTSSCRETFFGLTKEESESGVDR